MKKKSVARWIGAGIIRSVCMNSDHLWHMICRYPVARINSWLTQRLSDVFFNTQRKKKFLRPGVQPAWSGTLGSAPVMVPGAQFFRFCWVKAIITSLKRMVIIPRVHSRCIRWPPQYVHSAQTTMWWIACDLEHLIRHISPIIFKWVHRPEFDFSMNLPWIVLG